MHVALKSLAAIAVGVAFGLLITWATVVRSAGMGGEVTDGAWHTSLLAGSAESGPYLRAVIALHGLLALNRSETIYYSATHDDARNALDGACVYRITGRDPPARWWSITAYGADDFLITNPAGRYSVSQNSIRRRADGSFVVLARKNADAANQIALGAGAFTLTLRLYNPSAAVAADPAHVALPDIEKVSCT